MWFKRFVIGLCLSVFGSMLFSTHVFAWLSFGWDFVRGMLKGDAQVYQLDVDKDDTILGNVKKLFYPSTDADNALWVLIRDITVGVFFAFLVRAGIHFLVRWASSEDEAKTWWRNLVYIFYGWVLIFLAIWALWTVLDLSGVQGIDGDDGLVVWVASNLMIFVLSFLKWAAFFVAIIFLVYYGYKMMMAFDEEEKLTTAKTWILNVFLALVFIKLIDYLYYIIQVDNFEESAASLIIQITKVLLWIWGVMFVIAVIYAWFLFITSNGEDDNVNKAKTILKTVFVIIMIIFLFMLVLYQIFWDLVV